MRVVKDRQVIDDTWQVVADDAPLPAGDVLVSFRRWQGANDEFAGRPGRVGVWLEPDDDCGAIASHLPAFALVALRFPKFADGRGFSQARLLREAHGYAGELRAIGEMLRDQLDFMARCGIDSFEVQPHRDPHDALKAFTEYTVRYQPAADGAPPIWRLR